MADTSLRLVALAAAVLPAFAILAYFLAAARVRVDAALVWTAFGFGACAMLPAALVGGLFGMLTDPSATPMEISARQAFLTAAVPEEICKLAAVLCLCGRQLRSLPPNHLFAVAVATACGFACLENITYIVGAGDWSSNAVLRSLTAVPGHAFMGAAMGFAIARAVHRDGGIAWWALALVLPVVFHGTYNFPLFAIAMLQHTPDAETTMSTLNFMAVFNAVVIAQGAIAHLLLHNVLAMRGPTDRAQPEAAVPHPVGAWCQRLCTYPVFWGLFALLFWLFAGSILWGSVYWDGDMTLLPGNPSTSFRHGLAVFAVLHGLAFLVLAVVIARRRIAVAGDT